MKQFLIIENGRKLLVELPSVEFVYLCFPTCDFTEVYA